MSSASIEDRPRGSLTAQVLRDLSGRIERGELKAGDRLPTERELMAAYRVSRTVVREAISSLRASGRIETHQGRGGFVLPAPQSLPYVVDASNLATLSDVLQILDLRMGLESEAAALAAQRHNTRQLNDLYAALRKLDADIRTADPSVASDVDFHLRIIEATGNPYMRDLFTQLAPLLIPRGRVDLFKSNRKARVRYLERIQHEHEQIYQAIARRDAEAARAAVRLHLSNSRERLRAAIDKPRRSA